MSAFVLGSGSASRRAILENVGLEFEIDPARVDEDALKRVYQGKADGLALHLAEAKALEVANRRSEFVLGADQVLVFEGRTYDKARSVEEAADRLRMLRGKTHWLRGGVVLARAGEVVWSYESVCEMTIRDFSDAFLASYLENAGSILTKGVGAYAFEGLGAQLFERVEGDYYAVLGLPLLPVLNALREQGAIAR